MVSFTELKQNTKYTFKNIKNGQNIDTVVSVGAFPYEKTSMDEVAIEERNKIGNDEDETCTTCEKFLTVDKDPILGENQLYSYLAFVEMFQISTPDETLFTEISTGGRRRRRSSKKSKKSKKTRKSRKSRKSRKH
jgi:hypothetical protein